MSAVDEREAIGTLFTLYWAGRTGVAVPNGAFQPKADEAYVRLTIVRAETDQIEIGGINNTHRATGRIFVQVLVPAGTGDFEARTLCDVVAGIFRDNKQITTPEGRFIFRDPNTRDIGASGAHYQFNVSIPYLYDTL